MTIEDKKSGMKIKGEKLSDLMVLLEGGEPVLKRKIWLKRR